MYYVILDKDNNYYRDEDNDIVCFDSPIEAYQYIKNVIKDLNKWHVKGER